MPIFEYKCGQCGKVSEFLEKQAGKEKHKCPDCGSGKMAKQFSTFVGVVKQSSSPTKCHSCPSGSCPHAGH